MPSTRSDTTGEETLDKNPVTKEHHGFEAQQDMNEKGCPIDSVPNQVMTRAGVGEKKM